VKGILIMGKIKLSILLSIILFLSIGVFTKRHALACEFVGLTDYTEIAPNVFLDPKIDPDKHKGFRSLVVEGRSRISKTFGVTIARPKILYTSSQTEAASFGANSTATSHLTPAGACLVFGPKGQNIDVTAHELVHAEVFERVGFINYIMEIPVWFNEGVALIVDHRKPFLLKNIELTSKEIESVKAKITGSDFFSGSHIHKNYLASRVAVARLKPTSLFSKLGQIHEGLTFEEVFEDLH